MSLTVSIYSPLIKGGRFIQNLTREFSAYRHSIRAEGGYWDGAFSIRAGNEEMSDWLQNGLGRHVVAKNSSLDVVWEGFVNQVTITAGPVSIIIGPLMDVVNRTAVIYSLRNTTAGVNAYGAKQTTEEINNKDSQEKYGIISKYLSVSNCDEVLAAQIGSTSLEESSWPEVTHDIATVSHEPNIVVDCLGYVRWLERVVYDQTAETGDVTLQQKIKSVILSEPNGFFDMPGYSLFEELIGNGNFEALGAGGADIWASWTESVGDGTLSNVTSDHKEGTQCCLMTAGATFNTHIYQDITVTAGEAYRLTFWSRDIDQDTVTGTHSGGNNESALTDSGATFIEDGVKNGQTVTNTGDGNSYAVITNVTDTMVYGSLAFGSENDWDNGDTYSIVTGAYPARYQLYDNTNAADIVATTVVSEFGDTSWLKTTVVFYAPAGCSSIGVYLRCAATNAKTVHFDAVSFKRYDADMIEYTTFVPAYEDGYRDAWAIIKELLNYGDYKNSRYNWGVYADRKIKFEVIPTDTEYIMSARDTGKGYRTMSGNKIEEYNVLPGKWLMITDLLVGVDVIALRRDPKLMFIDEIRYSSAEGLTVNPGKTGTVNRAIAKLGLLEK